MIVLEGKSRIFKVDDDLFDDVKKFLYDLAKKRKRPFSYFDELDDLIIVKGDQEFVVPTDEDIKTIFETKEEDLLDEDEAKKY